MLNETRKAYLQMHVSVILWGFTAIIGKLITLTALPLVWYRMIITALSFLILPVFWRHIRKVDRKSFWQIAGIGCLVSLHWVTFYGSVKYANVSITLSCLATASFFTSLIEPMVFRQKIQKLELLLGLMIIPGVYMIFRFTDISYAAGIIMGIISAILAALFSTLNKKMVAKNDPNSITFIEMGSGWLLLTLLMPFYFSAFPEAAFFPEVADWFWLLVLAFVCTTFAYVLSIKALKTLSAFAAGLTVNLEPIYGILLAFLIFREDKDLNSGFYIGAAIIVTAVFLHPLIKKRMK